MGWGVPTDYLFAPVLNWTGLGCDKKKVGYSYLRYVMLVAKGKNNCNVAVKNSYEFCDEVEVQRKVDEGENQ